MRYQHPAQRALEDTENELQQALRGRARAERKLKEIEARLATETNRADANLGSAHDMHFRYLEAQALLRDLRSVLVAFPENPEAVAMVAQINSAL